MNIFSVLNPISWFTAAKTQTLDTLVSLVVRHFLTYIGGMAMAHGYVSADEFSQVAGAIVTLAGIVWSIFEKHSRLTDSQ